jgi:hypothetical protein
MIMNALLRNLLLTLLGFGTLATAGDQAAPAPAPGPTPLPKATPTPTPPATPTPDIEEQLEEFVPSEEVRADQAVAFPVDI